MRPSRAVRILSSWCAACPEAVDAVFPGVVAAVPREDDAAWRAMLESLRAQRLVRMLTVVRSTGGPAPVDMTRLSLKQGEARWDGVLVGQTVVYHKTALPYEAQARVAYEVFFQRFVAFVGRRWRAVSLEESDMDLELFVPGQGRFDIDTVWAEFVADTFSAEALARSFAPLVNSVRIAAKGFSPLHLPIVSQDQALFLAAFYFVNVDSLRKGDDRRRAEVRELKAKLGEVDGRERARLETRLAAVSKELDERLVRYSRLYRDLEAVGAEHPAWMRRVQSVARSTFTGLAGTQIAKAAAKVGKCVSQMRDLALTAEAQLDRFRPLLVPSLAAEALRPAGDDGGRACYACGRALTKGDAAYKANKFIFESPSQRLQSGGSQTEPRVCATCALVSFVSPIKPGGGRLVIGMRTKGADAEYLLEDQLRMLVMGEMSIVAGRYAMLQARERTGGKLVADTLGGLQYALLRVGSAFEAEVFERYDVEALIGGDLVTLPGRHAAWLHSLDSVFRLGRANWVDKAQFAALGRAIRHIQHEEVIFAIYELLSAGLITLPPNAVRASELERLRAEHVRWLDMDHKTDRAQFFRDVAAMGALLYAFCGYVRSKAREAGASERIEVRKVIERCDDPYQVVYTVAGSTASEMATLYRAADMHFGYDELKAFLARLGIDATEREFTTERGQPALRLFFDDVAKAYVYLFESRYKSTKEQRDLVYELKLSLHARFAELIAPQKEA